MSLRALWRRAVRRIDVAMLGGTARRILAERQTYLSPRKLRRLERAVAGVRRAGVPGDILEFGVALGGSALLLAGYARPDRRFYGLDVFATIPPPSPRKDDDKAIRRYEQIASGNARGIGGDGYYGYRDDLYEHVARQLARFGTPVDGSQVFLVKGLFEETFPSLGIERIAFAHIDCDWYEPVRYCLAETAKHLSPGGAIVIDDYHDFGGCHAAVDEFLAGHGEFSLETGPNPVLRLARTPTARR